jgi:hypothetical protein
MPPAPIGRVDLIFSLLDNSAGLSGGPEAPARRFVFGEQFATLLRLSGFEPAPAEAVSRPGGALTPR